MKKVRLKAKLTQKKLAKMMNVKEVQISRWETGRDAVDDKNLALFAMNCDVKIAVIEEIVIHG